MKTGNVFAALIALVVLGGGLAYGRGQSGGGGGGGGENRNPPDKKLKQGV
jgi:hypothetical protein